MRVKVTALVPCYNEETRVEIILKALQKSPLVDEIVVVDDASTDGTVQAVKKIKNIRLLCLKRNLGKGGAVREGVKMIKTPLTFLCDADVMGLDNDDIKRMITPVLSGEYEACLGVVNVIGGVFQFLRRHIMVLTGERVLKTEMLREVIKSPYTERWGLEAYMNLYFRRHEVKVKTVDIFVENVWHLKKVGFWNWLSSRLYTLAKIYFNVFILEVKVAFGFDE